MVEANCPICLSPPDNPISLCVDCHEPLCRACLASYMESTLGSAYMGTCPVIPCPSSAHHKAKRRRLIPFTKWKAVIPPELSNKYTALASSLLAFLCGGCHSLKTLDLGHEPDHTAACYANLHKLLPESGKCKFSDLEDIILCFSIGSHSVEETYERIHKLFPSLAQMSDSEAWAIFADVLRTIADPERRANLHLRYLRDRPRMKTLCCNREHCFRCKVKDFHEGKSCMENVETLDHSIVHCPTCGIALAKGDGCNTVTCVCGKQFSWSAEKENTERCQQFLNAYPSNTTSHCCEVLCSTGSSQLPLAKAWQNRHRIQVNAGLKNKFKTTYWPCPSHCATILPLTNMAEGWREAAELWRQDHIAEVERCKSANRYAMESIFLTLVPVADQRPAAASRILAMQRRSQSAGKPPTNERLIMSVNHWIESHKQEYAQGLELLEMRSAMQFLHLYGKVPLRSLKPAFTANTSCAEFNRSISNPDLTYTNSNTTVERVGSVSCYPAAFASLSNERATFRVIIDAAPKSSNWLTFGVAMKGMANSSSDGVGRTNRTWGLSDDRSSSSSHTIIAASGSEVGSFRKLRAGDILSATIDTIDGWCEIAVNEIEMVHRFEGLPSGTREDYWFAMSFANDHRVTILSDPIAMSSEANGDELNPDHTAMYCNLKKHLKRIMDDEETSSFPPTSPNPASIMTCEHNWIDYCGSRDPLAVFEELKPGIAAVLGQRRSSSDQSHQECVEKVSNLTYETLLHAVSWYRHNRDSIRAAAAAESAMLFKVIHGDDAPFIAAFSLIEYYTNKSIREDQQAALAYMNMFSEEMQEWYEYDAGSKDSVIEGVARGCRCLPRHIGTGCCVRK